MSELFALSFDASSSPALSLGAARSDGTEPGSGWGVAWYPGDGTGAAALRDPRPLARRARVLPDWDRFRSALFMGHVRHSARRPTEQDTHPFVRPYGGRDHCFAHSGQLDPAGLRALVGATDSGFEPVGATDSERAFCWLLRRMEEQGAKTLADLGFPRLREWLQELNALGTLSVILCDGQSIVAYADSGGRKPLSFVRRTPPHGRQEMENALVHVGFADPLDTNRTMIAVASTAMGDDWQALAPGELAAFRRASVVFRSGSAGANPAPRPPATVEVSQPAGGAEGVALREPVGGQTQVAMQAAATAPTILRTPVEAPAARVMEVVHRTHYSYDNPVERSSHVLRLHPAHTPLQRVRAHEVSISAECEARSFEDAFGNHSSRVRITQPYEVLEVVSRSVVELLPLPSAAPRSATVLPLVWMPWQRQMMTPFLLPVELPETQLRELSVYAASFSERQDHDVLETLRDINQSIRRDFAYTPGSTSNETTPFEVYVSREGVCQDFANLFICLARLLGVPARYRVGYIHTGADYENQLQSDASHAWAEVYLPWIGWRGFDPTNGCQAGLDHISVAVGRNYRDATPMSGTIYSGGGTERLSVGVEVKILEEHSTS